MKISLIILSLVSALCLVGATPSSRSSRAGLRGVSHHHRAQQHHPSGVQRRRAMSSKGTTSTYPTDTDPRSSNTDCGHNGACVTITSGHTAAPNTPSSNLPPPSSGVETRSGANQQQQEFGTGTRSIAVSVNYYENPQDVAWSLYEVNTGKEVLYSNYGEVTQPGVVTKQADGVAPGPYQLLMHSLKGQGISCGDGFCVEVIDVTNYQEDPTTGEVLVGGTVLFEHDGNFGPALMEEFNLYR